MNKIKLLLGLTVLAFLGACDSGGGTSPINVNDNGSSAVVNSSSSVIDGDKSSSSVIAGDKSSSSVISGDKSSSSVISGDKSSSSVIAGDRSSSSVIAGDRSSSSKVPVVEVEALEIDESSKTITVRTPSCDFSKTPPIFDEKGTVTELNYNIVGGTLFVIDEDGETTQYSGNNSSIYGTWTTSGPECTELKICETMKITETSISNQVDLSETCAFDVVSEMFVYMSEGEEPVINKTDCSQGTVTTGGIEYTLEVEEFSETRQFFTISTKTGSCPLDLEIKPLTKDLCKVGNENSIEEDTYVGGNMDEFIVCYIGLMFGGMDFGDIDFGEAGFGISKASLNAKAFSKALKLIK